MDPYTKEQVVCASADFHQQGNKDGQISDVQSDIEQLHQISCLSITKVRCQNTSNAAMITQNPTNSDVADQIKVPDQIGLHWQDSSLHRSSDLIATAQDILVSNEHQQSIVQVVDHATNQGIVEVVGMDICSAMVVWEGTTTAEDAKAAATYSLVTTSSKQIVGVDLHLQKTPYIPSSSATQQGIRMGKFQQTRLIRLLSIMVTKQDDRSASDEANTGQFVVKEVHTNTENFYYGQVLTVHTNDTEIDPLPQEWQVVNKKNNKTKGIVTRSQTKNTNSTWADKVEDEQVVEQSPISTTVKAGNKATQSRKQLERKMCKLGSRLNKMSTRDGMRSQLTAEMKDLQEEYSLLR